jgi:6-phosphogluconolactonase (cycloisomerase 2 family)
VTLVAAEAANSAQGIGSPVDLALTDDGSLLYALNAGNANITASISVFTVSGSGDSLSLIQTAHGLPATTSEAGVMGLLTI